jgi:hypothetical protein
LCTPRAFVGPGWEDYDPTDAEQLAKRTMEKFKGSKLVGTLVDGELVDADSLKKKLQSLPAYDYFDLGAESRAIDWVKRVVPDENPFPGSFPEIAGHDCVGSRYATWLARHAT